MKQTKPVALKKLSTKEAHRFFNRQARHYLKMDGAAFIKKWDAGQFNGKASTPAVLRVAMLLPFGQ
jgi:hypothetical protein